MKKTKLILLMFVVFGAWSVSAQQTGGVSWHPTANKKRPLGNGKANVQSDSGQFLNQSYYLDRRAKKWSLGLAGGLTAFHGDAGQFVPGWNVSPYLKYSVSQTFGLRGDFNLGQLKGERAEQTSTLFKDNFNFASKFNSYSLQMVFTLGNISYLRPLRRTQMYFFLGVGRASYKTEANFNDQRLFLGDYYWTTMSGNGSPNPNLGKDVTEEVSSSNFFIPMGVGFKYNLGKNFDLGLEYRYNHTRNDVIDAYNTQWWANREFDPYSFVNLSFGWKFGTKNAQHYDWLAPTESVFTKVEEMDRRLDSLSTDKDKDGVADYWDKDNATADTCMVYGNGMAVDTDGDGIPDCQDAEPFSDRGAAVDATGKMIDSDQDGVPDYRDQEPNSKPGALVDRYGVETKDCCGCENVVFPSIYFSTDADGNIKPEYYSVLYQIAERMKLCPDKKLVISGFGDKKSSKYNASTNTRRIDAIITHLNTKYGISRDRMVADYKGTMNKSTDTSHKNRRIDFRLE